MVDEKDRGSASRRGDPTREAPTPIVGIGASAGGLEALEEFFEAVPANSGLAFVVVTHLHPGHKSILPEILARHTELPISMAEDGTRVEPDHVYVSPAGIVLAILNGTLHLMEPDTDTRRQLPIDHFFRSLAQDQKDNAIGIVLSGTGSDGTLGLEEIKGAGGMVMAQEQASARYAGMPASAIATQLVDYVVPAREAPHKLLEYVASKRRFGRPLPAREQETSDELQRLFLLVRNRTGHDFSPYKRSTVTRRIERRMHVHHVPTLKEYVELLRRDPPERDALFREILIGVTSFFRDADAFDYLATHVLPDLVASSEHGVIRAWVPACSTGEEAYSLAILFGECMERLNVDRPVQIFATDIDPRAVEVARAGLYPESIAADVSPTRRERFFRKEDGALRIRKEVREMLVFAPQNLLADPPFTRLDLLSCRNLLIYLGAEQQHRLLPLFHYALRPGGVLLLGTSESVGSALHLFDTVDKRWKVFRRKEAAGEYVAEFSSTVQATAPAATPAPAPQRPFAIGLGKGAERVLLDALVPPTVIVHERGEILHIHGRTGLFLEPAPGPQVEVNVFNMARQGLQLALAAVMRRAAREGGEALHRALVKTNGDETWVELRAKKLEAPEAFQGLYAITFARLGPASAADLEDTGEGAGGEDQSRIGELEREVKEARELHQGIVEELETTNEELQSTNEELQSANEELETSKEEMQSLNEELQTVNTELEDKVEALSRTTDDMKNLLNATDIATLFLDNDLCIKRYTEQAKRVIRLIPSDVGRPLADITSRLEYTGLIKDAEEVLRTLAFRESEVRSEEGRWYLMRILPYRTVDNVIDGLVITFVDVTRVRRLKEKTRRFLDALGTSPATVFGQDRELRYLWACSPVFGIPPEEIQGQTDADLLGEAGASAVVELKRAVLEESAARRRRVRVRAGERERLYDLFVQPERAEDGASIGLTGVMVELEARPEEP